VRDFKPNWWGIGGFVFLVVVMAALSRKGVIFARWFLVLLILGIVLSRWGDGLGAWLAGWTGAIERG